MKPAGGVGGGGLLGIGPSAKPNVGGGHVIVPGGLNITCVNNFTGHTGPVWALSAGLFSPPLYFIIIYFFIFIFVYFIFIFYENYFFIFIYLTIKINN